MNNTKRSVGAWNPNQICSWENRGSLSGVFRLVIVFSIISGSRSCRVNVCTMSALGGTQ